MARPSRGTTTPFAWTTIFYLLFVLVIPLLFLNQASAQSDDQAPLREDLGDGNAP